MKQDEINKLKNLLDGLDDLPEDYRPNLESKFSVIQQSLNPEKKRRKPLLIWLPTAIAASLFLIGGLVFFKPGIKKKTIANAAKEAVQSPNAIKQDLAMSSRKIEQVEISRVNQPKIKRDRNASASPVPNKVQYQEKMETQSLPLIDKVEFNAELASIDTLDRPTTSEPQVKPKKKKARFRDIDFSEPLNPVMASEDDRSIGFQVKLVPENSKMNSSETTLFKHNF